VLDSCQPPGTGGARWRVTIVVLDNCNLPGLSGGYVGVATFFVISGLVITGLL